jgi:hypothetical protein
MRQLTCSDQLSYNLAAAWDLCRACVLRQLSCAMSDAVDAAMHGDREAAGRHMHGGRCSLAMASTAQ